MKHLVLVFLVLFSACLSVQPRCRETTVPVTWQNGARTDWAVRVCNVRKPLALHFVNDLIPKTKAPSHRRGCGPYQCSLAINGADYCFEEGDVYPTPCCEVYCTCWEADGLDCGWEF